MLFTGLQKLTLLDYPGVMSCTVFTQGCNFRCPFCHNASLVSAKYENEISQDEILEFLEQRKNLIDGVVVTGGEPTLHPHLPDFFKEVKSLGYLIKLDTNGTNPEMLKSLVKDKLIDYVAMDIKNSPEEYSKASGTEKFMEKITESKDFLLTKPVDYEFRTTVVRGIHTQEGLVSLARWIKGADKYFLQKYKDSGDILLSDGLSAFSDKEMMAFKDAISPIIKSISIR